MEAIPFHYAFLVRDLESTRRFYGAILGCSEGRSAETWVDFDLFGHQLSAHVSEHAPSAEPCGTVDGVAVPIPHFGCILAWATFEDLAERLRAGGATFVIEPRIRYEGQPAEQATMFVKDFSGNSLEFKAFRRPESVFAR